MLIRHALRAVRSYIEDKFDIRELLRGFEVVENLEIDPLCRGTFTRTLSCRTPSAASARKVWGHDPNRVIYPDQHPDGSPICMPQLMTIGERLATMGQG